MMKVTPTINQSQINYFRLIFTYNGF